MTSDLPELERPQPVEDDKVTIRFHATGEEYEFPILTGTLGPKVIDIQTLYRRTGHFTFDPGFLSTASCRSAITYIDGERGILLHRGYPIEQLAAKAKYSEVCYLLLYGDLPTPDQLAAFEASMARNSMVHEKLTEFLHGYRSDAHPMALMVGMVGAMSAFFSEDMDVHDPEAREDAQHRIIAKMSNICAMAFKYAHGEPLNYPRNNLDYASNFLQMCFAVPTEDYQVSPIQAEAMNRFLVLHADHEQNASAATVRIAGSSRATPYACIAAGIASLWGPAHGGANAAVMEMLEAIGDKSRIPEYIKRAKDRNDPFRLMGFGHRVYKNYDPRARILRESAHDVIEELDMKDEPLFELALELERIALQDDYFIEHKLFPNVDFYSGIMLRAMGFPTDMFPALFALGRTAGWVAQWREMIETPNQRIDRPRQLYEGETIRPFVPLEER